MAACQPPETCQDGLLGPLDPEQCQVLGEGCVCSEGTILHRRHSGLCIPEEKCGRFLLCPHRASSTSGLLHPPAAPGPGPLHPSRAALCGQFPREGLPWDRPGLPTLLRPLHPAMPPPQPARTAWGCRGPWGRPGTVPSVAAASTSAKLRAPSSPWTWAARTPALRAAHASGRWLCSCPPRTPAAWGLFVVSPNLHFPGH